MFRHRAAAVAASLLVIAAGTFVGDAMALPFFTPGAQTPFPLVQPVPGAYIVPVPLMPADLIGFMEVGRDDTSPYAMVTFTSTIGVPGIGIPPGGIVLMTYRPVWDSALHPTFPAVPAAGVANGEWTGIDVFSARFLTLRNELIPGPAPVPLPPPYAWFWVIPGPPAAFPNEFYKFNIRY